MERRGSEAENDAACIRRSLADPAAFGLIFRRHGVAVHRYLSRRAEGSAVDDLHAETFVSAFRSRLAYDLDYPDARPWLYGIATHVVHHHRRSEGRRAAMVVRVEQRTPTEHCALDPAADVVTRSERIRISKDGERSACERRIRAPAAERDERNLGGGQPHSAREALMSSKASSPTSPSSDSSSIVTRRRVMPASICWRIGSTKSRTRRSSPEK
jgi:DNA-directed RNA polymerase specialized sigma24 family protein